MPRKKPEPQPADPVAQALEDTIAQNEAMLSGLVHLYGQELLEAQQGGEAPSELRLLQINQLRRDIENDRQYLEARKLTARRSR